ncbi:cytochrome P450 [Phenylobacterium kunshanense]|uniref:Cytochrome P450 n=1 Tax=Phenylobacterium kunshanense TaxID=1445034 RepID=A0A328BEJ7_9CAUL|nr:cytochrome P450 [Phenylobacterium kunshanense]RAK65377.1 cytochrome P450 [Phenylobacterium kunshanense]
MKIDLLSPASFDGGQPHRQYAWLREHQPVTWHDEPGGKGFWAVTRHADVWAVDRDFQTYSSEPTIMITDPLAEAGSFGPYKMMLMMDPPEHTGFRKLIRSEFTEPSARLRGERIQALAKQIVDAVADKGECDFVDEVAGEMPSYVIAELMGLPLDDGRELYKLTEIIHTAPEALPPGAGGQAVMKMFEYGSKVMAEKRARPGDDLASRLLACEVDGRRLEDMEFLLFFLLLIDAGGDTTRNLLSGGLLALMEHPDQYRWLMEDLEGRLPTAREELLRWASPVIYMRRTAKRDTELGGQKIREGDKVVMYFGSANRDPAAFERPDVLDLSRADNPHMAFGNGPHVCLGQHLARIEIDAMLREVLTRMKDFELAAPVEWLASNFISGPKAMPLRFRGA